MLLIGIAGANATARERVARAMRDAQICTVSVYTDAPAQRFGSHEAVNRWGIINDGDLSFEV